MPVHSNGCKGQGRDMEGAVLCKPTDMAHPLPKDPGTVHKTSLKKKTISFMHPTTAYRNTSSTQFLVLCKDTYKIAGSLYNCIIFWLLNPENIGYCFSVAWQYPPEQYSSAVPKMFVLFYLQHVLLQLHY